jgi:hypothetical protein
MKGGTEMKKTILISVLIIGILVVSSPSFGNGHGYYGGCGWGYCGYNGWEAAAIVGGSILLGTFLGMAINNNYRYPPPPQKVYVYPEPEQPYVSPDPAFIERYSSQTEMGNYPGPAYSFRENVANPPGSWVIVPGQWVGGNWVPAHNVWVPENP